MNDRGLLRVSSSYRCWPTWLISYGAADDVDPATLGLPDDLVRDLLAWADDWDATVPPDDPGSAAFASADEEGDFYVRGDRLAHRVADVVGDRHEVQYHPDASRRDWATAGRPADG